MRNNLSLAFALFLVACGGGGLSSNNDGSSTNGHDMAVATTTGDMATSTTTADLATSNNNGDGAVSSDVSCGNMSCSGGSMCCVTPNNGSPTYACMTTCGSGTFAASCDGPENCASGACCANVMLGSSASSSSGSSACESSTNDCSMANFNIATKSGTTKLCHVTADCAGYMSNLGPATSCCTYTNAPYYFCAPGLATSQMGVTCKP